jgi:spermidine synthase
MLIASFALIIPFSFFIGFLFPIGCRVFVKRHGAGAREIALIYIAEAVGSLAGGALFTFVLVAYLPTFATLAIWLWLVFAAASALIYKSWPQGRRFGSPDGLLASRLKKAITIFWAAALLFIAIFSLFSLRLEERSIKGRWKSFQPQIDLVESRDSKYQNIVIAGSDGQYNLFGSGQYVYSFPDPYQFPVTAHLIMAQHPEPHSVLLIGGAPGLAREMLKHPIKGLDYVELDPLVLEIIEKHLSPQEGAIFEDPRLHLLFTDGRFFVKRSRPRAGAERPYDLIFVDAPDPTTAMLNRFYTLEFFEEIKAILRPGGVLVITSSSAENYLRGEVGTYAGTIYKTLSEAFSYVKVTPGATSFYFASDAPEAASLNPEVLTQRFLGRGIQSDIFPYLYSSLLPEEKTEFINEGLAALGQEMPLNTDRRPVSYFLNLILWARFSGPRGSRLAEVLLRIGQLPETALFLPFLGFLSVILVLALLVRKRAKWRLVRFSVLWSIVSVGFAGMALEIILIFGFQNIFGYVYQKIGLIVAIFMAGLAGGAILSRHWVGSRPGHRPLIAVTIFLAMFAFCLPFAFEFLSEAVEERAQGFEYILMTLVAISGFLTGAAFPLASEVYLASLSEPGKPLGAYGAPPKAGKPGADIAKAAGRLDACDHLGAYFGAFLTGIILIPLLGSFLTSVLVMFFSFSSAGLLVISGGTVSQYSASQE